MMQALFSEKIAAMRNSRKTPVNTAISALGWNTRGWDGMSKFQEMVRARLRERTPNVSALARFLGLKDVSVLHKKFKEGGTSLCLDWLDDVTAFYQMSVSEMTAVPGAVWQEVKPLEAQLLTIFRDMTELEKRGLLDVLDRSARAVPAHRRRRVKLGTRELTDEQQLVVDLYARSEPQAREGVLKILKGTAKAHAKDGRSPSGGTTE